MKNRILNKLRSRRGASITYALLLFLVCAVLCSVILTAGTAAAGRMSKMAETDQRYYAVTSAAELLTDMIDGKTVTITEVHTTVKRESTTISDTKNYYMVEKDTRATQVSGDGEISLSVSSAMEASAFYTIEQEAAYRIYLSELKAKEGAAEDYLAVANNRAISMTAAGNDALTVEIKEKLNSDGTVILKVKNASGDPYSLELTFTASKDPPYSTTDISRAPYDYYEVKDDEGNVVDTVTLYETTTVVTTNDTVTWRLTGITTVGGAGT